jgi:hypothetical protein
MSMYQAAHREFALHRPPNAVAGRRETGLLVMHHYAGCYRGCTSACDLQSVVGGIIFLRQGGHFPGSAVLHGSDGAEERRALFTGATIFPVPQSKGICQEGASSAS